MKIAKKNLLYLLFLLTGTSLNASENNSDKNSCSNLITRQPFSIHKKQTLYNEFLEKTTPKISCFKSMTKEELLNHMFIVSNSIEPICYCGGLSACCAIPCLPIAEPTSCVCCFTTLVSHIYYDLISIELENRRETKNSNQ